MKFKSNVANKRQETKNRGKKKRRGHERVKSKCLKFNLKIVTKMRRKWETERELMYKKENIKKKRSAGK